MKELTKDANVLFGLMCGEYLKRVKSGMSKNDANYFESVFTIQKDLTPKWELGYAIKNLEELIDADFVIFKTRLEGIYYGRIEISSEGIVHIENRIKNGIDTAIEYFSKIKSIVPFI